MGTKAIASINGCHLYEGDSPFEYIAKKPNGIKFYFRALGDAEAVKEFMSWVFMEIELIKSYKGHKLYPSDEDLPGEYVLEHSDGTKTYFGAENDLDAIRIFLEWVDEDCESNFVKSYDGEYCIEYPDGVTECFEADNHSDGISTFVEWVEWLNTSQLHNPIDKQVEDDPYNSTLLIESYKGYELYHPDPFSLSGQYMKKKPNDVRIFFEAYNVEEAVHSFRTWVDRAIERNGAAEPEDETEVEITLTDENGDYISTLKLNAETHEIVLQEGVISILQKMIDANVDKKSGNVRRVLFDDDAVIVIWANGEIVCTPLYDKERNDRMVEFAMASMLNEFGSYNTYEKFIEKWVKFSEVS